MNKPNYNHFDGNLVLSDSRGCICENNFFYPLDGIWTDEKKAEFIAWRERCGKDDWRYNDPLPWVDDKAVADFTRVCEQTGLIDKLRKE